MPSPNLRKLAEKIALAIESNQDLDLNFTLVTPQHATEEDVHNCDGILILTTENLGYMSGLTKDFFDRIYYPCLESCQGLPYALIIRAGHDGTGTKRAIESITTGLKWRQALPPLICRGEWQDDFLNSCQEVAQTFAAGVELGVY